MLIPYPTALASEDWQLVTDLILSKKFDGSARTAHVVYDAVGYVLGQALPDPTLPIVAAVKFESHPEIAQFQKVGAINWASLFALLMQLLPLIAPFLKPVTP